MTFLTQSSLALRSAMLVLAATSALVVTACSETSETIAVPDTTEQTQPAISTAETDLNSDTDGNADSIANTNADENNTDDETAQGAPVQYDVSGWKKHDGEPIGIEDLKAMQAVFGKVVTTDENSLDYASNTAVKYRFMDGNAPYLDVIDSQEYLESGWYFANPNDTESEKNTSISHAKKVYQVASGLMGEAGEKLVEDMLKGQIIKNETIGGQQVALAKCEFYSCMLIIDKPE